jgi:chromosome segregation ATPase
MAFKLSDHKELLGDKYDEFRVALKDADDRARAATTERDQFKAQAEAAAAKISDLEKKVEDGSKTVEDRVKAAELERDKAAKERDELRATSEKMQADFDVHRLDADIWEKARAAGLRSRAYLAHIDRSGIKRGEDGKLEGLDESLEALQAEHAVLFGGGDAAPADHGSGNAPPAKPPGATPDDPKAIVVDWIKGGV